MLRESDSIYLARSKNKEGRLLKGILVSLSFSFFIFLFISSSPTRGGSLYDSCPTEWRAIVGALNPLIYKINNNLPIIGVNRNGTMFNCFGAKISESDLASIEKYERGLPFDRNVILSDKSSAWPSNVCSVAQTKIIGLAYLTIYIPDDAKILNSNICERRIKNSLIRIVSGN